MFVIESVSEEGYWSNKWGWVFDLASATRFEDTNHRLPISAGNDATWITEQEAQLRGNFTP